MLLFTNMIEYAIIQKVKAKQLKETSTAKHTILFNIHDQLHNGKTFLRHYLMCVFSPIMFPDIKLLNIRYCQYIVTKCRK